MKILKILSLVLLLYGFLNINAQIIQHLDATEETSIERDDANIVSLWKDQSGNNYDATVSLGNIFYIPDSDEGDRPWVDFGTEMNKMELFTAEETDTWLDQSTTSSNGFCVLIAFKINSIIGNWNDLLGNSSAVASGFGLRYGNNGNIQAYLGGKTINKGGENLVTGDNVVFAFNYNTVSESYEFWDSKSNATISGTVGKMDFSLDMPFTLGATNGDSRFFDGYVGEVKVFNKTLSESEFLTERQQMQFRWVVEDYETVPPTPNPASFVILPQAVSSSLVSMTATVGSDVHEPVQYFFAEITGNPGGSSSGWQYNNNYRDGDLLPQTEYAYTVMIRDSYGNAGENSDTVYVTTPEAKIPGQENELDYGAYYGYQGWHFAKGDDRQAANDWVHWFESQTPDAASIHGDMWPDLSEYDRENLYETLMQYPDGEVAKLYSCFDYSTIDLHIKWMADYGIKGCAVQRFTSSIDKSNKLEQGDKKIRDVMTACEKYGVKFWIMHDSGQGDDDEYDRITADWKHLVDDLDILQSPMYTWQDGKPVYGLWGIGVSSRQWTPEQASAILDFYQNGEEKYQTYVYGGVPRSWRTNPNGWKEVFDRLDMISPWRTIFNNVEDHTATMVADYNYCQEHGIDYSPVVSPGASTKHLRDSDDKRNWKPRNGGYFLWSQVYEVVKMGSKFMYVAMFDEVDEGTAMYKLVETEEGLPVGADQVSLNEDGYDLPSDWYLQLGTEIQKMLDGTISLTEEMPLTPQLVQDTTSNPPVDTTTTDTTTNNPPIDTTTTDTLTWIDDYNYNSDEDGTGAFKIYPIPAQEWIRIDGAKHGEIYKIYDLQGILRKKEKLTNSRIDISYLPPGYYVISTGFSHRIFKKL